MHVDKLFFVDVFMTYIFIFEIWQMRVYKGFENRYLFCRDGEK